MRKVEIAKFELEFLIYLEKKSIVSQENNARTK